MTGQPGVGTWIDRRARVAAEQTALILGDTGRTYADLAERLLLEHPAVAEACVLGGENGAVAYIVRAEGAPAETESTLLALCRDRLPRSACPAAIRSVGALPRSANGKILRRELQRREMSRSEATAWSPCRWTARSTGARARSRHS